MEYIRIVLIGMPRMLREIVKETLTVEADMTVVAETSDIADVLGVIGAVKAELVIAGTEALGSAQVGRILEVHPRLKVIAVSADGRQTLLYGIRPRRVALGELAPDTLTAAIRDVCTARSRPFEDP